MSLPQQLYELQQIDIEIQNKQKLVNEIAQQLSKDQVLVEMAARLSSQKEELGEVERGQRNLEWDLADLEEKFKQINSKLYSGAVKSPKELVSLEQEAKSIKKRISEKEDRLLESISQVEEGQAEVKISINQFEELNQKWQERQGILKQKKAELETQLSSLSENRHELIQQFSPELIDLYERIKLAKGQAIAKVSQGKCQGCHIALPLREWQRVKVGEVIQCSSCGRILYLE
jgi:hypothetical protein